MFYKTCYKNEHYLCCTAILQNEFCVVQDYANLILGLILCCFIGCRHRQPVNECSEKYLQETYLTVK